MDDCIWSATYPVTGSPRFHWFLILPGRKRPSNAHEVIMVFEMVVRTLKIEKKEKRW